MDTAATQGWTVEWNYGLFAVLTPAGSVYTEHEDGESALEVAALKDLPACQQCGGAGGRGRMGRQTVVDPESAELCDACQGTGVVGLL